MSECEYLRRLGAYHDGELPEDERAKVAAHLGACPACLAELARLQKLSVLLGGAELPAMPAGMAGRLHARLRGAPEVLTVARWARGLMAAAATVLVVSTLFLVWQADTSSAAGGPRMEDWEASALTLPSVAAGESGANDYLATWIVADLSRETTQ